MDRIDWHRIASVIVGCLVVIVATGHLAYDARKDKSESVEAWIDQDTSSKAILVGTVAGAAFGLIDNTLLWLGMSSMDSLFVRLPGGDQPNVLAGYGNAFSSVVSAFVSTFVGRYISSVFGVDVDRAPLWSMAVGILLGCVIGIVIPMAVLKR